jgi:hypothetical protein
MPPLDPADLSETEDADADAEQASGTSKMAKADSSILSLATTEPSQAFLATFAPPTEWLQTITGKKITENSLNCITSDKQISTTTPMGSAIAHSHSFFHVVFPNVVTPTSRQCQLRHKR